MSSIKIKVNGLLPGYAVGKIVEVLADQEGTPLDAYWRRKLKDAMQDNCCEVVKETTKTHQKTAKPEEV